jgi:hypothetical protein
VFILLFNQTAAAVICFGILLFDLYPAFLRVRKNQARKASHT